MGVPIVYANQIKAAVALVLVSLGVPPVGISAVFDAVETIPAQAHAVPWMQASGFLPLQVVRTTPADRLRRTMSARGLLPGPLAALSPPLGLAVAFAELGPASMAKHAISYTFLPSLIWRRLSRGRRANSLKTLRVRIAA